MFERLRIDRRRFLGLFALVVGATSLAVYAVRTRLRGAGPARPPGERELATLIALGEVLIPPDATPGADAAWVRGYVRRKLRSDPRYAEELRAATALLDGWAREVGAGAGGFAELPASSRDALLRRQLPRAGRTGGRAQRRFERLVLRPLIVDFYRSPSGWAAVGYANYPGVPGDPRAYAKAPRGTTEAGGVVP